MNALFRHAASLVETAVYGPSYGALQALIRQPEPLDPEWTWKTITSKPPAILYWLQRHYPPVPLRRALIAAKMRQDHLLGISEHYDVSNDFYRLFLDGEFMFYSCADFARGDESLEAAQAAKADFLLRLIEPRAGQEILDLGCGWGAMMKRIHQETGDRDHLVGYTLSREQVAHVRELGYQVELENFITCDYEAESWDRIYSIGAWEHVRHADLEPTLAKLHRALRPDGRLVKHFFCPFTETLPTSVIAAQIFFPGSFTPAFTTQVRTFERAGFRIVHQSIHDYRPTLRAWFDNLVRNADRAIELVGVRTFNKYLVFFPASWRFFEDREALLVRHVLEKTS